MTTYKRLEGINNEMDFRKCTRLAEATLPAELGDDQILIKTVAIGVNAADLFSAAGMYFNTLPFPIGVGVEGVGIVEKVGKNVTSFKPGDAAMPSSDKTESYSEYMIAKADECYKVPAATAEYIALNVSGLTAAISLGEMAKPKKGDYALVTAAAGGTGQFAVQLLKHVYGCTVIGTCSTAKVEFLKSIGCDHVIDYRTEDLDAKLSEYAPNGLNVIYESVGGATFNTALNHVAPSARVLVIGNMSGYLSGEAHQFKGPRGEGIPPFLVFRNVAVMGFTLHYMMDHTFTYFEKLLQYHKEGKIKVSVDPTPFSGLEHAADAIEYIFSGKSFGKVVLTLP